MTVLPPTRPSVPSSPASPAPVPGRVLIVRPTALGDVSRSVPVLASLRQALPDAQIDWLVNEAFVDAVRHHPALNDLVAFPRRRFGTILYNGRVLVEATAWARDLKRRNYDMAIDVQGLLRSGLFTRLTGAPARVGFDNAREMGWLGYNRRHHIDRNLHTVDRMLALVEAAGYEPQHDMRLYVGADDQRWLKEYLDADESYLCIAPTARWRCKCWPIERYTEVAERLLETGVAGHRLVLLAAPDERDQVEPLIAKLQRYHGRVLFPKTTVGQLMGLLSRTNLLVCNDSAPLHIAVGFDRPIVTIFGPTDPALVGPYRRSETVVRPPDADTVANHYRRSRNDQSLIARVNVEDVWEKIEQQLSI